MGKKNKKKNFRSQWQTLTELGTQYGVSARKFGSMLKQHGLRNPDGSPSEAAEGMYQHIQPKQGHAYYLWGREQLVEFFRQQGIEPTVSSGEAQKDTEARKLARSYMEAQQLDDEGSKLGHWMFCDMVKDIKKIGLERFNKALKSVGYKGEEVTLEDWA